MDRLDLVRLALLAPVLTACASSRTAPPPPPPRVTVPEPAREASPQASEAPAPEPAAPTTRSADARTEESTPGATPARPPSPMAGRPLGWIAGQALMPEELLVEWGDISSRELYLVVDKLVASRLALAEAERLGIRLDPALVEQRLATEREELDRRLQGSGGLEERIRRELGFEPGPYLERVRRATIRHLLAERAVRLQTLQSDSLALRLIVVPDEATLSRAQEALAAGRDFADVAREFSVDDSREEGGLVPFVVPEERSTLARLAYQTPVGETAEALKVADHFLILRVEERRAPLEGEDWADLHEAVETSLRGEPVRDSEFVHWKLQVESRYPIDLGPLWSLLGSSSGP